MMLFPSNPVDGKHTINQARGMKRDATGDRFDLTLECIRRYYEGRGTLRRELVWCLRTGRAPCAPRDVPEQRTITLNRVFNEHPERFTRRPRPPQIRTEVWINEPVEETPQTIDANVETV